MRNWLTKISVLLLSERMVYLSSISRHDFALKTNVFQPDFVSRLNNVALESAQNKGRFKPKLLGTILETLNEGWISSLSRLIKTEKVDELLGTEIWATAIDGGLGFAIGMYNGKRIIMLHPEQAESDYVPGLLHEIKHIIDILNGREVSLTPSTEKYKEYRRLPSERRARDFEKKFIDRMYNSTKPE